MNSEKFNEEVEKTVQVLKSGGTLLYPTDTVWGLGCDAENQEAVERIYEIKGKREGKSFIVLVNNEQLLHRYSEKFPEICYDLIDAADSPLTIVYPNAQNVAQGVAAEDGSLGMRLTKHRFTEKVIQKLGRGLVSTSANLSGQPTDGSFDQIPEEIKSKVDYIVDWERDQTNSNKPSSVIKIGPKGEVEVLRK